MLVQQALTHLNSQIEVINKTLAEDPKRQRKQLGYLNASLETLKTLPEDASLAEIIPVLHVKVRSERELANSKYYQKIIKPLEDELAQTVERVTKEKEEAVGLAKLREENARKVEEQERIRREKEERERLAEEIIQQKQLAAEQLEKEIQLKFEQDVQWLVDKIGIDFDSENDPDEGLEERIRREKEDSERLAAEKLKQEQLAAEQAEKELQLKFERDVQELVDKMGVEFDCENDPDEVLDEVIDYSAELIKLRASLNVKVQVQLDQLLKDLPKLNTKDHAQLTMHDQIIRNTHDLLTNKLTVAEYQKHARTVEGKSSPLLQSIGAIMLALATAVLAFALAVPTGGVSLEVAGATAVGLAGPGILSIFAGRQRGISRDMEDLAITHSAQPGQ